MPAGYRLREIVGQTSILKVVAHQHRAGEGQHNHDNVALEPDEVAESVGGAVQVQLVEELGEVGDFDRHAAEWDRLLCGLNLNPDNEILAVKEEEEDHEGERVQPPEQLAAGELKQRQACHRPRAPDGALQFATPGAVAQQFVAGVHASVTARRKNSSSVSSSRLTARI